MADGNKRIEIKVSSDSQPLINDLKRGQTAIGNFSSRTMAVLNRTGQAMNGIASKYLNGITMLAGGAGFTYLIHQQANFEDGLREIGRTGGYSAQQMAGFKAQIMGLISPANKLHIALSKEEWAGIAEELNNTGISLGTIQKIMPQIGMGAEAAHADTKQYAATMGDFIDKYKVQVSDLSALQDSLNVALKMPDVKGHTNEFLQAISQMALPMRQMGIAGKQNTTQIIALLAEMGDLNGGDFAAAGMSINQMFNAMLKFGSLPNSKALRAQLDSLNIHFFDQQGKMKPFPQLLPELKKLAQEAQKRGYDTMAVFQNVFGRPEAAKAFADLSTHEDEVEQKTKQLNASAGDMRKDWVEAQGDISKKWVILKNQFESFTAPHLEKVLDGLMKAIDYAEKHPALMKGILTGGVVAGGTLVASKTIGVGKELFGFGKDIYSIFKGKGKGGILGKVEGAMTGATPVYVVNMGSMSSTIGSLGNEVKKIGTVGKVLGAAKKMGGAGISAIGSGITGAVGSASAFLATDVAVAGAGAIAGTAAIGAAIGGGIGLGVDYAIGKVANKYSGGKYSGMGALGEMLFDYFHKQQDWEKPQNNIVINFKVDSQGRAIAESNSPTTRVDAVKHGNFFPGVGTP